MSSEAARPPAAPFAPGRRRAGVVVSLGLVVCTVFTYWPVRAAGFVNFDDPLYVTANDHVKAGLTLDGIRWAMGSLEVANWHPLTWLSHMLDCTLFGVEPGAHHLVSVGLHAVSAVVLFLALDRMTRALWKSAFVAALFAFHPLHVESVAWVSERKDVLSTLFFMLALFAYARYAERPRALAFLPVVLAFALGLMAKAMLVTLPCVLLLLDVWPLGRLRLGSLRRATSLVLEKLPLFALSAAAIAVGIEAQHRAGAVVSAATLPFATRAARACVAYARYVGGTFWPAKLSFFYPIVQPLPAWQVAGAIVLLAGVSAATVASFRRRPWLAVGWLWFLGTLVPTIGLLQIGGQAIADRYTYVPTIGLSLMAAWSIPAAGARVLRRRLLVVASGAGIVAACVGASRVQAAYWTNDHTLFEHALSVTRYNWMAHKHLGYALLAERRPAEAIPHLQAVLRLWPGEPQTPVMLVAAETGAGAELASAGRYPEAVAHLRAALGYAPDHVAALTMFAWITSTAGDIRVRNGVAAVEAAERAAVLTKSSDPVVLEALAAAYAEAGRFGEARAAGAQAVERARALGIDSLAAAAARMMATIEEGRPYREAPRSEAGGR